MFAMRAIGGLACLVGRVAAQTIDYSQYVNPFIGSEGAIPGYACKYSYYSSHALMTLFRWRWRRLCWRHIAIWHGEARPRYL